MTITIAGCDLAWHSQNNTSALVMAELHGQRLQVTTLYPALGGIAAIVSAIRAVGDVDGVAIDASLIINNPTGQRACETALAKDYARRKAGCHPTNLSLYPKPCSVALARQLQADGYQHLQTPGQGRWQLECYPHPALIEIFGLKERLLYKKGSVADKRAGQMQLAHLIQGLANSPVLALAMVDEFGYLDGQRIRQLSGNSLKQNEDVLDAIVCAYVGGLYALGVAHQVYGDADEGYIYVPKVRC